MNVSIWLRQSLLALCSIASIATVATVQAQQQMLTAEINGVVAPYSVPQTLPPQLAADGKTLSHGGSPRALIADPIPRATPLRIVPPRLPASMLGSASPTQFQIDYVPAGGTDLWGQPCGAFPVQAQAAFTAAANIWAQTLRSTVPIRIRACWASFPGNTLGYAGGGALVRAADIWYPEALANALTGVDTVPNAPDMHITYNSNFNWYFGIDGHVPLQQMDLMTVVLHEIAHGLGFAGLANGHSTEGSLRLGGSLGVFDTFYRDGSGNALSNTTIYPDPSLQLKAAFTSNDLWFHGSAAMAANGGQRVQMFAPASWMPGSSYSHLDYQTFVNTPNALMVFALSNGVAIHDPGAITRGIFQDIGWQLVNSPEANDTTPDPIENQYVENVELNSVVTFSPVSVTGINAPTPLSISGGEYSINGGAYTNAAATVRNGEQITVRHTAAASGNTETQTRLNVGGVVATFTSRTQPQSMSIRVVKEGLGSGTVTSTPAGIHCGEVCQATFPLGAPTASQGVSQGIILTATAAAGSTFGGWSENCIPVVGNPRQCRKNVAGEHTVTARFNAPSFPLQVNTSAGGVVSSSPSRINCSAAGGDEANPGCRADFLRDSSVTLTATAHAGYRFTGWSGDCRGTAATCTTRMTAAKTVTATFRPVFDLQVMKTGDGQGTVRTTGINCDVHNTDCAESYTRDTRVTLTVTAAAGSHFTGWSGACSGTSTTCNLTIDAAKTVTAGFERIRHRLIVTKAGQGEVVSVPAGISCGNDCEENYLPNTSVTLTATAASGFRFTGWSGDCRGTAATCTTRMTAAKTVTATFRPLFTLNVSKSGDGQGSVQATGINCDANNTDCAEEYLGDTRVTLRATPSAGMRFAGWSGACSGTATSCTLTITAAKQVTANFEVLRYRLQVNKVGLGNVASTPDGINCGADCEESYRANTSVTLTATPAEGQRFVRWSGGGCSGSAATCTTNMTATKTVTATFRAR